MMSLSKSKYSWTEGQWVKKYLKMYYFYTFKIY